jgi:hypothetical protein
MGNLKFWVGTDGQILWVLQQRIQGQTEKTRPG